MDKNNQSVKHAGRGGVTISGTRGGRSHLNQEIKFWWLIILRRRPIRWIPLPRNAGLVTTTLFWRRSHIIPQY